MVRDLIGHLRAVSTAPIGCGGPAFSILPVACFDYLAPDRGLAGDAATSFGQLVECLAAGGVYTDWPGLVYCDQGHTVVREEHFTTAAGQASPGGRTDPG